MVHMVCIHISSTYGSSTGAVAVDVNAHGDSSGLYGNFRLSSLQFPKIRADETTWYNQSKQNVQAPSRPGTMSKRPVWHPLFTVLFKFFGK